MVRSAFRNGGRTSIPVDQGLDLGDQVAGGEGLGHIHVGAQRELFSRIAFNILCSNTDDHLSNHAAFWNGSTLELSPAYDICPQSHAGEASLATAIDATFRIANLRGLLDRAALERLLAPNL